MGKCAFQIVKNCKNKDCNDDVKNISLSDQPNMLKSDTSNAIPKAIKKF